MGLDLEYQFELQENIRLFLETRDKKILQAITRAMLEDMIITLVRTYVSDER